MNLHEWQQKLEDYLLKIEFSDKSHDLAHFRRVWKTALSFEEKDCDLLVVLAGAYLHDIVSYPKNHPLRAQSSKDAAIKAQEILSTLSFPIEKISGVMHAIETHSYSAKGEPKTIEAKVLQDADRMEALGAIGLARTFYTAGLMGSKLFDDQDPFAKSRELNDRQYAVDHFELKLLKIPHTMHTISGKKLAAERVKVLTDFLDALKREL
jgi:uncharacterized protein